jgi:hypothetical protein
VRHGKDFIHRVFSGPYADEEVAFRTRKRNLPLRHEFLAFIEQAQGVHRGLHIVTIFLFALWPLPLFAASLLPAHALELVVGKPQELLGARARKKDALILHDFRPNGVLCDALGKQKVQRRGIALRR